MRRWHLSGANKWLSTTSQYLSRRQQLSMLKWHVCLWRWLMSSRRQWVSKLFAIPLRVQWCMYVESRLLLHSIWNDEHSDASAKSRWIEFLWKIPARNMLQWKRHNILCDQDWILLPNFKLLSCQFTDLLRRRLQSVTFTVHKTNRLASLKCPRCCQL